MTTTIKQQLHSLKLTGISEAFDELLTMNSTLALDEAMSLMLDRELSHRKQRQLQRLLKMAKLRFSKAVPEDIDHQHGRNLKAQAFRQLLDGQWINKAYNVLITGATGLGKSWLACAIGQQACRLGMSTLYVRLPKLMEQLRIARIDGSYGKVLIQISKVNLLIIDDWGIGCIEAKARGDMLEIIEDRHGIRSTLITSQLPINTWHDYIGDHGHRTE